MDGSKTFAVQAFEHVEGRLVASARRKAVSARNALQQAEALAAKLPGSVALQIASESGRETVTILGAFGDVPDEVAEGLAGG